MHTSDSQMHNCIIPQLQSTLNVLHLLYYRNKNQHRRGQFWKWLSILKRCLGQIIEELMAGAKSLLSARLLYLNDTLLPRCYT